MNVSELINLIVEEWAYRVNDGMPDVKNPTHLNELGIVLSEMGLSHIKNDLVKNLTEAEEGGFKNPALNKKINYKNAKGEDKEGIVGNLLRLPAEHPGRKAAERTLPPEGSEERDSINKDLGGEGQPTKPEEPKGKEGGEDKAGGEEEKMKQAQAMFDPKVDPAMAQRLDKEKETQAQIAKDAEAQDKEAEKPAKEEKPKDTFDPIPAQDVQNEIPEADPETFGAPSDFPDGIEKQDLEKFNTDISKVQKIVADAKAKGEKAPNINLCDVTVPGTNLYCDDNLGIPRDQMPQFKGKPIPGTPAADMPLNKDGEVDTEPLFKKMLEDKGITVTQTEVPADKLKATQSELGGDKVVGMMGALEKDPNHPGITGPVYVSRDGFVIDGHHRWAAIAAYNAKYPDKQIPMKTQVVDMDIKDAIPMCNKFAEDMGIAAKKQGETTGKAGQEQPEEKPKKVSSFTKMTDKIKEKISKWQKDEKEFFEKGYYKAGSEARRTLGQAIKDKAKGAWKAIKAGAKHEVEEFKTAGKAVGKVFSKPGGWNDLSHHEKDAIKAVGIKIATTAIFGAAMGGLSYGAAGFAKHVAIEFVPHVVAETLLKGAGRAAIFADGDGEAEIEANMEKFMEMIAKGIEEMDISEEQMEAMVDSYNEKKDKGEIDNMENPEMKEELLPLVDKMINQIIEGFIQEVGPDTKFSAKSKETGKIVYFKTQQAKDDAIKAGTHDDPKKAAGEPDTKEKPTQNIFTTDPSYQQRLDKEKDITQKSEPKLDIPTPKEVPIKPSKKDGEAAMRSTANRAQSFKTRVVKNVLKRKLDGAISKDVRGFAASDFKTVPGEISVPSKEFSGFYHRGGGYYSQTPDGPITHVLKKMVESVNEAPKPKQSKVKKADLVPIASLNLNPSQKAAVTKVANQAKKEISELPSPTNEKTKKDYRDKTKKSVIDSLKLKKSDVAKKEAEEKLKLAADIKAWERGGKKGPKPKKKSKGVGLGSPDSRAGESAVVLGSIRIHELVKQGKSYQQARQIVEQELMKYVGSDTYLTKSWVKSALNTLDLLEREVGFKNIGEFGWDNPEGRALVGSQGHGTSADMFIRTKDGKRIGVSLKKDLKVFVFNGGYTEMSENLKERGFSFSEKSSPEYYVKRRAEEFEKGKKDLIKNKNKTCKAWENIKKKPAETFDPLDKRVNHILKKTGKKNLKSVTCDDFVNNILSDTSGDTMKMLSQFYQNPEVEAITPAYKRLRGLDKELTDEIAKDFSKPENEQLVKDLVRDETHISDILFSDNPNLDELKVVYGTEPAIEMKKEKLVQLFGVDKLYAKYENEKDPKKKEALKKKIEEEINKRISVSTKGGVMSIAINVTDSEGKQSVIPLFEAKIRTRGIGAAPTFEMAQNTFGGLSFKYGTSDFTKWDEKDRKVVVLSTLNDLEEEFGEELQHLDKKTQAEIGIRLQELEKISPNSPEVKKFRDKYFSKVKK